MTLLMREQEKCDEGLEIGLKGAVSILKRLGKSFDEIVSIILSTEEYKRFTVEHIKKYY